MESLEVEGERVSEWEGVFEGVWLGEEVGEEVAVL